MKKSRKKSKKSSFFHSRRASFSLPSSSRTTQCIQNDRKFREVELLRDERRFKRVTSSPHYDNGVVLGPYLFAARKKKTRCNLIRPLYVGFAILDLAKSKMLDYWHLGVEKAFAHCPFTQLSVLVTDTGTRSRKIDKREKGTFFP